MINPSDIEISNSLDGYFIENKGQVNELVRYYSRGNPSVAFRDDGVMLVIGQEEGGKERESSIGSRQSFDPPASLGVEKSRSTKTVAYMLRFEGANPVSPVGRNRLSFNSNFFIGNNPVKWRTDVPNYEKVEYPNLYDGVDLTYRLDRMGMKYEFTVSPGVDPGIIQMKYEGIDTMQIDRTGMIVRIATLETHDSIPYSYDETGKEVSCTFTIRGSSSYGFDCSNRDSSKTLIIDPLIYSTFFKGAIAIAADNDGNAYMTSCTFSPDFPVTPGAYDTSYNGLWDAIISKLDPTGSELVYSTFIGGSGDECGDSIALDSFGNAHIVGQTFSSDFPVTNGAFDTTFNGFAFYVLKLDATGSQLIFSTFIDGFCNSGPGCQFSIAVDLAGGVYITGSISYDSYPTTPGAFDTTYNGGTDTFVTKLKSDGSALVYSTWLGGSSGDGWVLMHSRPAIAVDSEGNAFLTGYTDSADFPTTPNAIDSTLDDYDAYVCVLNPSGNALLYSTYLGGTAGDYGNSIALDSSGAVYVLGWTGSHDFPVTPGAFDTILDPYRWSDLFVAKLDVNNGTIVYATLLGGDEQERPQSIAVNSAGNAYITGGTPSTNFPTTPESFDRTKDGLEDVFVTELNARGNGLVYSTFLGGNSSDFGRSIALDTHGNVYLTGSTGSNDFPTTPGAFDTTPEGGFVVKMELVAPDLTVNDEDIGFDPQSPTIAETLVTINSTVRNVGSGNASTVIVRFYDGQPPSSQQIGVDQLIPFISRYGGAQSVSVAWLAGPPGIHDICVFVDPDNDIAEENEFNNIACSSITVLSHPDLTPISIDVIPYPPLLNNTTTWVNVTVSNLGDLSTGGFDILLIDDRNKNVMPDAGENISLYSLADLGGHSQTNVSFSWTASPVENHSICAYTDPPPGMVDESNETNNVMCVDVLVVPEPVLRPDYTPVSPLPLQPIRVGMSSPIPLSIQVYNQGNGTATNNTIVAFYEPSLPPFSTSLLMPLAPANMSSRFSATWISPTTPGTYLVSVDVDYHDNVTEWDESNNEHTWIINVVEAPITFLAIGLPNYTSIITYVRSTTPLDFSVVDQGGSGINHTWFRIDNVTWTEYSSSFFLAGEGAHYVEWFSEDNLGNVEAISWRVLVLDDTPPATAIATGEPEYLDGGTYVTSSTPLTLTVNDNAVGPNSTFYRLWGGSWSQWRKYTASFNLIGRDGLWYVEFLSYDYLGNKEVTRNETYILDNTPPATTLSPTEGPYTTATAFGLAANDVDCGVNVTFYKVDGGSWNIYTGGFTLAEGQHNVSFYSVDMLNNTEAVKWRELTIPGEPPADVEANYKPVVALIFAIILLIAGLWSSLKRPWNGGEDWKAVGKAFTVFSLPFVIAEAATGVISCLTGELSIPPSLGLGTILDASILTIGLMILAARVVRKDRTSAKVPSNEP